MLRISFQEDPGESVRLIRVAIPNEQSRTLESVADRILVHLRAVVPVSKPDYFGRNRPGILRDSLKFRRRGRDMELWGADYGLYVIGGTRPHPIVARRKPFLVFYWEKTGRVMYLKRVRHPGTKPNDFREAALDRADADVRRELNTLAERIMGRVKR